MAARKFPERGTEEWWRWILTDRSAHWERFRNLFLRLPSPPHCKLCGAPFKGPGGLILGAFGFSPWEKNPTLCKACFFAMSKQPPGGAEIPSTLLFADMRGSTGLAEQAGATEFAALLRRFYAVGSQAVINEHGVIDKLVGDEVVGLFIPAFAPKHALGAIRAARRILGGIGHGPGLGPWLNVGIGIHSGPAFVGTVAVGSEINDFTALGDTVNTASRLGSEAGAGEILVSEAALAAAGLRFEDFERRELALRGREASLAVRVARYESLSSIALAA